MWNDYPKHFLTSMHDQNDVIAIYGNNPYYHNSGQYFVRLRPDFKLYDLISQRQYIYNMYAFSQAPSAFLNETRRAWETLELGEDYLGFIN